MTLSTMTELQAHLTSAHDATHELIEALVGEMDQDHATAVLERTHHGLHSHRTLVDHDHDTTEENTL